MKITDLEKRIELIEKRNNKVEMNKAWEISLTRKIIIAVFTYIIIASYLKFVVGIDPWINAIVPTVGFLLSTLTISWFKIIWLKYVFRNK